MHLQYIVSNQTEPYWNIAVENYLVDCLNVSFPDCLSTCASNTHAIKQSSNETIALYLWRNRRTVVIGQNQNPYSEVNVEALEGDGGYLMRRKTGGGAVYHDDCNINFSFVVPKALYDQPRQFAVIQRAVESFGLHTELSGRNDILAEGRKFSGNAFSKGRANDLHHGTILIGGNMDDLQRYLRPKPAKMQKHGVASVRSRVVNLSELNPAITSESLTPRLRDAFEAEYGGKSVEVGFIDLISRPEVKALHDHFASAEWKYGNWRTFTAQRSGQYDWGGVEVSLDIKEGVISDVQIASDALDLAAVSTAADLLRGASTTERLQPTGNRTIDDILSLVLDMN